VTLFLAVTSKAVVMLPALYLVMVNRFDKKTLGQLIGLDDCSGSAVYEGDVVAPLNKTACGDYIVAEIKYVGGAFVASTSKANWNFHGINCMHHKISGNIHDNPELMTQKW
jgi:uncharacterized phage protein (TIGR01671 family)